jgi:hypothetical protein
MGKSLSWSRFGFRMTRAMHADASFDLDGLPIDCPGQDFLAKWGTRRQNAADLSDFQAVSS